MRSFGRKLVLMLNFSVVAVMFSQLSMDDGKITVHIHSRISVILVTALKDDKMLGHLHKSVIVSQGI